MKVIKFGGKIRKGHFNISSMGRKREVEHLKPGEERELKGLAKENPWQYKNNLVRLQRRDGIEYEIEIHRRDGKVFFKRA